MFDNISSKKINEIYLEGIENIKSNVKRSNSFGKQKGCVLILPFCTYSSTFYEGLIGRLFIEKSYSVKIISKRRLNTLIKKVFNAFDVKDISIFASKDYILQLVKTCFLTPQVYLQNKSKFKNIGDIKNASYKNFDIGEGIITDLQRSLHKSEINFLAINSKIEIFKSIFKSIFLAESVLKITQKNKPLYALMIEAHGTNKIITDILVKAGCEVIQFVQPFHDSALTFKRLNERTIKTNPNSVDKSTIENFINNKKYDHESIKRALEKEFSDRYNGKWFMQKRNQPNTIEFSKNDLINFLKFPVKNKPTCCIFSHVLWDGNLFYGKDLYSDYSQWLLQTVKAAIDNTEVNWIIKLHPANIWKRKIEGISNELAEISLFERHGISIEKYNHIKLLLPDSNISTDSIFKFIDFGVTVRGTVGLEMPCFGVTVLTAGTGRYSNLGFTIDSQTINEYEENLRNLHKLKRINKKAIEKAEIHAYLLLIRRLWVLKSVGVRYRDIKEGEEYIFPFFYEGLKSHLNAKEDMKKLSNWLDSKSLDYIS